MTLPRYPTTVLLRDALTDRLDPIPVGLGKVPTVGGTTAPLPYAILLPLWTVTDGPAFSDDLHSDVQWVYQVSLYAQRGDQLEGMRDRVQAVVLGRADGAYSVDLNNDGVKVTARGLDDDTGTEQEVGPAVPSTLRFRLWATPDRPPA